VTRRRREFTAGRVCARRALARLGFYDRPVMVAPNRAPIWPDGIVGSITHTEGFCAAAVAQRGDVVAVGIDAERHRPMPTEIHQLVCQDVELEWCKHESRDVDWPTVLFCAKEAVYKAWSSMVGSWLDFHDVYVAVDLRATAFVAHVADGRIAEASAAGVKLRCPLAGRFNVDDDFIQAAVVVRRNAVVDERFCVSHVEAGS